MRTDKERATNLRKQGKSYREICEELGVAKSTLSNWFAGQDFSEDIKEALTKQSLAQNTKRMQNLNQIRGAALTATYEIAESEALRDMERYRHDPLFLSAVSLYWGEGDKLSRHHVRISNTDPKMLRIFFIFLTGICEADKNRISIALFLYEDLDDLTCKAYWSKQIGHNKFHKTQILPSRHKIRRLEYGTASIVITDSYLKRKMNVWIDHLPEMVLNTVSK